MELVAHDDDNDETERARWTFVMEAAYSLPTIDLDVTAVAKALSPDRHARFLALMRHYYARFGLLYRVSGVVSLTVVFIDAPIGRALPVPALLLAAPALTCSTAMMSTDIMRILVREYEFWFFTIMKTINWGTLATFYWDARIVSLIHGLIGTQVIILIDANFRTVVSALKSVAIAAPVLTITAIACFFRLLSTQQTNYRAIPVANITVLLVDVFVNTALTLAVFIARKSYTKRKVMRERHSSLRAIRCVVFRARLRLVPLTAASAAPVTVSASRTPSSGHLHMSKPAMAMTMSAVAPWCAGEMTHRRHQAHVTLVPLKLPSLDVRRTVAPRFSPLLAPASRLGMAFVLLNGAAGLALTMVTLTRPRRQDHDVAAPIAPALAHESLSYDTDQAIAALALVTTTVCCVPFFLSCQRDLLRLLVTNFDFLFSSVQFVFAMAFLADMLQWDHRALGALAWLIWFHFALLLDALTPPLRVHLRFRKRYLAPMMVLSLVGVALIMYTFFFATTDIFVERTLMAFTLHGHAIALRTKSLLLNRLFTVTLWSLRLAWEVTACPEHELTFIRGGLEYFNPMEMFPPLRELHAAPLAVPSLTFSHRANEADDVVD